MSTETRAAIQLSPAKRQSGAQKVTRQMNGISINRGKVRYAPILEWKNRETADRFSAAVTAAIEEQHPGSADEGE